jgi:signal transduction histidine kinase
MFYKEVDMSQLVYTVLQSFHHQIKKRDIGLEVGLLPKIITDYLAVEQIIGNLLDNAIKYLKPGQSGKISIRSADNGDEYLFSVQDNGRGIAITDREKVFEIFRRAGIQDVPGEGMGLAYVRTLVRQLGGVVWCESEPLVGQR